MVEILGLTNLLAALYGLYLVAAGIGLMREPEFVDRTLKTLANEPLPGFLAGILTLALGGTIVAIHNEWTGIVAGLVSLIGWVALLEGLLLLAFRNEFIGLFARIRFTAGAVRIISAITIAAGLVLLAVVLV